LFKVLVTGGGTIAPIDDVRHIANVSSGRFSSTITESCLRRGAEVWHLHAPQAQRPFHRLATFDLDSVNPRAECERLNLLSDEWSQHAARLHLIPLVSGTVAEYGRTLRRVLTERSIDAAFLAMAVSDFEPEPAAGKLESDQGTLIVQGKPAPKIIRSVRDWAPTVYLVGFKLLSNASESELIRRAEDACRTNRADLTVANDWQTVRSARHVIHLVRPGHAVETLGPGPNLADQLVERVFRWLQERPNIDENCVTSSS
jgi:phosphopantothenate---cysteine ligase (CTP)